MKVFLIDPLGSSLAAFVRTGEFRASPGSSIAEGVGIGRLTANFKRAADVGVDEVFIASDQEAVDMAFFLLRKEGVWIGPSAAMNVVAAVKAASRVPPGATVVTVLCDGGARYASKMFEPTGAWLKERGLAVSPGVLRGELPAISDK